MKGPNGILQERFSSGYEKYFRDELFERKGFERKTCPNCSKHFWTMRPDPGPAKLPLHGSLGRGNGPRKRI